MKRMYTIIAFVISVVISQNYVAEHWIVGPVFGVCVLIWIACRNLRKGFFFVLVSTLIYAVVCEIVLSWGKFAWTDIIPGDSSTVGVLVGSVLMSCAYVFIIDRKRSILLGTALLTGAYFITYAVITAWLEDINMAWLIVGQWQGVYLLYFCRWPFLNNK
jgi:hypothetical protein